MASPNFGVQDWSRIGIAPFPLFSQKNFALGAGDNFILGNALLASVAVPAATSTSVEFTANVACRISLIWVDANPAILTTLGTTKSFHVDANSQLAGWAIPNRDSYLIVKVTANASGIASMRILTGLPPINQSAVGSDATLLSSGGASIPSTGNFTVELPPFSGYAQLSGFVNTGTAVNDFIWEIDAATFQGVSAGFFHEQATNQLSSGDCILVPTRIFLPPFINTLKMVNLDSTSRTMDWTLYAIGQNAS